jgi:hypothetical protein
MTPDKPSWWQMFEPIHFEEREEHSLIGGIEPVKETARQKADRIWGRRSQRSNERTRPSSPGKRERRDR